MTPTPATSIRNPRGPPALTAVRPKCHRGATPQPNQQPEEVWGRPCVAAIGDSALDVVLVGTSAGARARLCPCQADALVLQGPGVRSPNGLAPGGGHALDLPKPALDGGMVKKGSGTCGSVGQ